MQGNAAVKILVVEPVAAMARLCHSHLSQAGYEVFLASSGAEALEAMQQHTPQITIADLNLPDMQGITLIREAEERSFSMGFVMTTSNGSIQTAVDTIRAGAHDFIVKPFSAERIVAAVKTTLDQMVFRTDLTKLKTELGRTGFCGFVGGSAAMRAIYTAIEAAAPSTATIFITGESGTGKELAAEAVHALSGRKHKPFVAVNCGAIPVDLIESEMFGHLRGSFTGAVSDRKGAAQQADGGTLFLDEVCEMHLDLQSKLLRFLQSGAVRPVGASRTEQVDVRVVCATNRDPLEEVKAGRFREDLYYRLHVVPVLMPPLRKREADILLIAEHLMQGYVRKEGKEFRAFDPGARDLIARYDWPGNIRQLQNVLRNAVVMNNGEFITAEMLPIPRPEEAKRPSQIPVEESSVRSLKPLGSLGTDPGSWLTVYDISPLFDVEQAAVTRAIELCSGNIPRAAAFLLVSPSTVYRKIKNFGDLICAAG